MTSLWCDVTVFDLDGTLIDTAPDLSAALNHTLKQLGRPPVALDAVRHLAGKGARVLLNEGLRLTGNAGLDLVERGMPTFLEYYEDNIADLSVVAPDVEDILEDLQRAGAALAICTNKPERLARKLVAELGWTKRFRQVVGGDSLRWKKPDPRPLVKCIEDAGGGSAAFVGNSQIDYETAKSAEVPYVDLAAVGARRDLGELNDAIVIESFAELLPALARL